MTNVTLVTLGCSSLCQTATSWVKAARSEAISASDLWLSSPQSRSLTELKKGSKVKSFRRMKRRCVIHFEFINHLVALGRKGPHKLISKATAHYKRILVNQNLNYNQIRK